MNYEPPMDFASWPPQDKANWLALVERKRCEATSGNSPKGLEPTLAPSTISQATREYHAERDLREPLRNRHDEQLRVAAPAQSGRPATCVDLICASSLNPEPVSWLWQWWLARGKMHIVGGQPGAGKTTLAMLMTSIVTRGGRWPDGSLSPSGTVVIWSGEDDPADTLVTRLIAMRADMEKVHFVGGVMEGGERRPFDPAKDIPALAQAIGNLGNVALIIVDPVVSAVAGDSHKNTETRRSLQPLVDLAASVGSALLGITHFTKGTAGREPVERITGSLAFAALARIVMIAAKEAEGEGDAPPRRFLARAKSNIGPDDGGFAYDLQQVPMPGDDSIVASIATFGEAIEGTARAMLAVAESEPCEDRDALSEAESFLQEQLTGGPVPTNTLKAAAGAHAISWRTIERAKKSLGVEASQKERKWFWKLTPPATPTPNSWRSGGLNLEEGDEI